MPISFSKKSYKWSNIFKLINSIDNDDTLTIYIENNDYVDGITSFSMDCPGTWFFSWIVFHSFAKAVFSEKDTFGALKTKFVLPTISGIIPDESVSKTSYATYNYKVTADVTDINGETHSTETNVTVGYQALQLAVSSDAIVEVNNTKPIYITTNNLNGVKENDIPFVSIKDYVFNLNKNKKSIKEKLKN